MSGNSYKQATRYFGIPVLGWEDTVRPEVELLKWQMIENMIVAAMRGNVNAVFEEGDIRIIRDSNGTYTALATATGNNPSIRGSVAGAYFDAPSIVEWKGLEAGLSYYLYIKGSTKTFYNSKDITPVASKVRLQTKYATLIAKADLTRGTPVIDKYPAGKVNARDLAQHVLDDDNPHGEKTAQDEILIRNRLAIGDGNNADLELDVDGRVHHIPVSKLVDVLTTSRTIVDFVSGGRNGVTLTGSGRVVFANVVRTGSVLFDKTDKKTGDVIVGFYGSSPEVHTPDQIIVWNLGDEGIPMRAMIVCG